MAEIEPCYVPIDYTNYNVIELSSENISCDEDAMLTADANIKAELENLTVQYELLMLNFQGECSQQFKRAMMTLYGKANKLSAVQMESVTILDALSIGVSMINEEALEMADTGGEK